MPAPSERPILVVVRDTGPEAEDALALGERIAAIQSAPLVVARVLAPAKPPARAGVRARRLEIAQTRLWVRGAPYEILAVAGPSPRQELHALARERRAQLLVASSEPHAAPGRVQLGRWEASSVVHDAPCGVAVAPSGQRELRGAVSARFGVAFDGLPESLAALHSAHALACAARVPLRVIAATAGVEGVITDRLEELGTEVALERVDLAGNPIAELIRVSGELDLLVCGSRDRRPLRRLALGRTPLALMRSAACPLVVVAPGSPLPARARAGA